MGTKRGGEQGPNNGRAAIRPHRISSVAGIRWWSISMNSAGIRSSLLKDSCFTTARASAVQRCRCIPRDPLEGEKYDPPPNFSAVCVLYVDSSGCIDYRDLSNIIVDECGCQSTDSIFPSYVHCCDGNGSYKHKYTILFNMHTRQSIIQLYNIL